MQLHLFRGIACDGIIQQGLQFPQLAAQGGNLLVQQLCLALCRGSRRFFLRQLGPGGIQQSGLFLCIRQLCLGAVLSGKLCSKRIRQFGAQLCPIGLSCFKSFGFRQRSGKFCIQRFLGSAGGGQQGQRILGLFALRL